MVVEDRFTCDVTQTLVTCGRRSSMVWMNHRKRPRQTICHTTTTLLTAVGLLVTMICRPHVQVYATFIRPSVRDRRRHGPMLQAMHRSFQATQRLRTFVTRATDAATVQSGASSTRSLQFADTPLGQNGTHLLDGLDQYMVESSDDGHPLAVYGISSTNPVLREHSTTPLKPILLLHGRTWSSVPVYHLLGGSATNPQCHGPLHESRSLMEALLQRGLQPYCMDFRGFGGTPMDDTRSVNPNRCVQDAESVLHWISARHGLVNENDNDELPSLLGWSQGALVAQLVAQKTVPALSKVILYGSIYDPLVRYPREPLYLSNPRNTTVIHNQFDAAIEDFTVEGTIPPEPARRFAEAALLSDPIRAVWSHLYQFNNCDPARVHVPCLVVAGDQDPYAPLHVQQELFGNLGRTADRTWSIVSGSDHACHLLDGRFRLINTIVSFVMNGSQSRIP